jgi:hypothetical protein
VSLKLYPNHDIQVATQAISHSHKCV